MRNQRVFLLAGVALTLVGAPAYAQDAADAGANAEQNDIVVTARRKNESLQDVPQTVNVVSADKIEKLRILSASDITRTVTGLSIESSSSGSGGFGSSSGIRGVPTFLNSNATPIIQYYLNDAPLGGGPDVTSTFFDIGQVEVLKGPQGTLRGRSAPGGAITITTKRPDLDDVGGYAYLSGTDKGNINLQGAVGLPIIPGVLALRVAGAIDHNDGNGVTSVNKRLDPYNRTEVVRATLLFQPSPDFTASVMYQRYWNSNRSFSQVFGPGNGINGPAIAAGDRLGITDQPNEGQSAIHYVAGQFDWSFAGQKLSYVGSYRKGTANTRAPQDVANVLPGIEYFQFTDTPTEGFSHELRLASEERIAGIFDYVVGGFYSKDTAHPTVDGVAQFLPGAFNRPGASPVVQDPVGRYTLRTAITIDPESTEASLFGNVTAHLGENTELSAGGRYIEFKRHDKYTLGLVGGFVAALNNPTGGFIPCSGLGALNPQLAGLVSSPVYNGVCDIAIPSATLQNVDRHSKFTPFVYNVSLSHKFSPDFMVYGTVGSAFRSAGPQIGITSLTTCCTQLGGPNLGTIEDLIFHGQEKSTSYELGFKGTFLDRRGRLNVSVFKQKFSNYFFLTQATRYLSVTTSLAAASVGSSEFTADVDAKTKGIDIEAGFQITPRWSFDLGFTWAKAELDNALVPCNDGNFDGTPDSIVPTTQAFINAGVLVARCRSNASISRTPRWNLSAQSEFSQPISDNAEGFIRGNFVYYPDNPNSSQGVVIDKYSLLNLFAGIRSPDSAWEVSLFANNILNTRQVLSVNPVAPVSSGNVAAVFGRPASGYQSIAYTPRREFGLQLRYAFGSR